MASVPFSYDLAQGTTATAKSSLSLLSLGPDGLRLVSGAAPQLTLDNTKGGSVKTTRTGYSAFWDDAYTNGIINNIQGNAPQTLTSVQYKLHLVAGETLSLAYDFIPGDASYNPQTGKYTTYNDTAFALITNSKSNGQIKPYLLANVQSYQDSGHKTHYTYDIPITVSADYTILLAVADIGDKVGPSALTIRSINVQAPIGTFTIQPAGLLLSDNSVLAASSLSAVGSSALAALNGALGAGLISQDGGGLISQDGGGFKLSTGQSLISQDGGGLISQDGGGLIAQGAGNLIAQGGGNVVFSAADAAAVDKNIASFNAGQAASLVAQRAGNLVAQGAGNLVAQGAGNLLSTNSGTFHVLAFSGTAPLPPALLDAPDIGDTRIARAATTGFLQYNPTAAALTDGRYVVVYTQKYFSQVTVRGTVYNADGTLSSPSAAQGAFTFSVLNKTSFDPSVTALANGGFLVSWTELGGGIRAMAYDRAMNPTLPLTIAGFTKGQTSLATLANGDAVLVYMDELQGDGSASVSYKLLAPNATLRTTQGTLTAGTAGSLDAVPAVTALSDGRFAVALSSTDAGASNSRILLHVVTPGGTDTTYTIASGPTRYGSAPNVVALTGGNLIVTWLDDPSPGSSAVGNLRGQVITAGGVKVGGEIAIASNAQLANSTAPDLVALPDGRWMVTYQAANASGTTLNSTFVKAATYNADGTPSTDLFNVASGSNYSTPSAALLADGTVVVATAQAPDLNGATPAAITVEPVRYAEIQPIALPSRTLDRVIADKVPFVGQTTTAGQDDLNPAIAGLPGGPTITVWQANPGSTGGKFGIFGQLSNADGSRLGSVLRIDTLSGNASINPTVTGLPGGAFVVAWSLLHLDAGGNGFVRDIVTQRFDANGNAVGSNTVIGTGSFDKVEPNLASLSGGGYVVTWANGFMSSSASSTPIANFTASAPIAGQRFAADGTAVGPQFTLGKNGYNPVSAGLQDGGFVTTWYGSNAGGSSYGIYAQVFGTSGGGGTPILLASTTAFSFPSVATLRDGSFVITWSEGQSGSGGSAGFGFPGTIRAQTFSAAGVATSAIVTLATNADVSSDAPAVTVLNDGRIMVAWNDFPISYVTTSGNTENVRARVLNADLTPSGSTFAVNTPATNTRYSHPAITQTETGTIQIANVASNADAELNRQTNALDALGSDVHITTFGPPAAPRPVTLVRGQLVDGYIKGATVFADANNNGVLDAGEQTATTGANGEFFFASDAQGPIVAIGGIDTATKVAFTGTLTAPQGSTSVTALSTLVQRIAATNGGNVGAAMARVNQALGLPADAAITTIDPVAATLGVSSTAATAFLANANLFGSVALASAAGATGDLFGKLATAIAAGTGTFDPTSVATMTTLGLSGQVATDTAAIATSEKLLLATKLAAHPNDPTGLVADVYAVETAVQAQAAPALKTAAANGTTSSVAGTYTGNNLTAIAGAAADTASGNPPTISYTDTVTNTVGYARSDTYSGPVDYLQKQYIWASDNAVALSAAAPNSFIKGGASGDALVVTGGKNVLDGAGGSNYLIGADGSDGGYDTFFVDARGGVETWSTIINFHQGDQATIFGFHPGLSTRPFTENEGAAGAKGLTIHSEINGAGTGILASMTFTGLTQADADAHFSITTGTLLPNTAGAIDYMLIQYNR